MTKDMTYPKTNRETSRKDTKPTHGDKVIIDNMGPRLMCIEPRIRVNKKRRRRFRSAKKPNALYRLPHQSWITFRVDLMMTWRQNQIENILFPLIAISMSTGIFFLAYYIHDKIRYGVLAVLVSSIAFAGYHTLLRRDRIALTVDDHKSAFREFGYQIEFRWKLGGAVSYVLIRNETEQDTDLESTSPSDQSHGDVSHTSDLSRMSSGEA